MSLAKRPIRSRLDAEQRREQILQAASRIISQRGYYGFGIQQLARECGITNAGLLYYFETKERLLIAVLEDRDRRDAIAVASIAGLTERRDTHIGLSLEQIFKVLRAIVQRNSTQPEFVRLFAVLRAEALNQTHPARKYFVEREAATLDAFARMVAPHVPAPRSTARQLLALMSGLQDQWLRADQGFKLVTEWDRGVALLLPRPT
jgi:AcrR family transcriptional regulator